MAVEEKLAKLNILVAGKTGVGKSTLINSVFGQKMVDTGCGKPVTQSIHKIEKEGAPFTIYDTPGMELQGEHSAKALQEEVRKLIDKGVRSGDASQAIHCIWYCINTQSSRIEQTEMDFLQNFAKSMRECKVPVILVLTQAFSGGKTEEMMAEAEKAKLPVYKIVPVLAEDFEYEINGQSRTKVAYGCDKLIQFTCDVLPETVKDTLIAMQRIDMDEKQTRAKKTVKAAAVAAAAAGVSPIPFSDAALLVPMQVAMLMRITAIFDISIGKAVLTTIASSAIGTMGTTFLGKTIVSNALKFIPGIGTVAGGAVSAATAAALTTALGNTYIDIVTGIAKGEMDTNVLNSKEWQDKLQQEMQKQVKNS